MNTENHDTPQFEPEENKVEQANAPLEITADISSQLVEAARWSKFLAILGFVFMGFMVVTGIIMSIAMAFIPRSTMPGMPIPPFLIGLFYLVMAGIYLFPLLYLYRFSSGVKLALRIKDQAQLRKAFSNLKAHYRFIGILMIVTLALYVLVFIVMIAAGLFAGFSGLGGMQV